MAVTARHGQRLVRGPGAATGRALAFYTLFALAPGLVILIPLTSLFLGKQAAHGHLVAEIESLIGPSGAEAV